MTNRLYSGRPERTRRMPRRGVVRRGLLPSFGDIVLPVVSVAAIGLLILAGRQFFLNGMKTSPGISSTRAYAEAPALVAERERAAVPVVQEVKAIAPVSAEVVAEEDTSLLSVAETIAQPQTVPEVVASPAPSPKKTARVLPANKQWRIQVGAYGTRANAQKEADKIKKAGYKATIYSNPASKYVKVWVQGGADKASAERVVNAMKKLGYKSSFSFPPAK